MAKRKQFGKLSKSSRDRAARIGREQWGLSRDQVRDRYNRGTFNPFARANPELRVPREYRRAAGVNEAGQIVVDWEQMAYLNYNDLLGPGSPKGETYKYNPRTVQDNLSRTTETVWRIIALATESELRAWASIQPDANGNGPGDPYVFLGFPVAAGITMEDLGYYDRGGSWNNIFWYH
jgi:hypothetical protein